jgi:hypothetical protein
MKSDDSIPLTTKQTADLSVLRLAAAGLDVRAKLKPKEIARIPSLKAALDALDKVIAEMGWADEDLDQDLDEGSPSQPAKPRRP